MVLLDPVVYLIESHVQGLELLLAEFINCNAYSSGIVHLDFCGSLFPSHFIEGGADGYCCLGVDEYGAVFGLGCQRHDIAHTFAQDE